MNHKSHRYFLTDQQNKSWRGILWGENITHEVQNPNWFFETWSDPLVAAFLYPCSINSVIPPKIWECHVKDNPQTDYGTVSHDDGLRRRYPELTTLKEFPVPVPTHEQIISFGMICSLAVSRNPLCTAWIRNWLLNINRTPETAASLLEGLFEEMTSPQDSPQECYVGHVWPLCRAVIEQDGRFAAYSAYRAWLDSRQEPDYQLPEPEFSKLALIALNFSPEEIGYKFWNLPDK